MKTVTLRELHNKTGDIVRQAGRYGEIVVTDDGETIARILPMTPIEETPFFARRRPTRTFKKLDTTGITGKGTDSTQAISEDREDRS